MDAITRVIEKQDSRKPAGPRARRPMRTCKDCHQPFVGASLATRCRGCKRVRKRDADGFPDTDYQPAIEENQ